MSFPELPRKCGVYLLYAGDECVYVGSSVCIRRRVKNHNHRGRFDQVKFILCDVNNLAKMEQKYIDKLKPRLNVESKAVRFRRDAQSCQNQDVFAMRLRPDIMKALHEQAEKEQRKDSNMGQVLIYEALKARGVEL